MGRKGRWFDAVQRILSTSEPDHEEKEAKVEPAERSTDKSNFKKIWQLSKSNPSDPSTSAAPETAPVAHRQQPHPPPSQTDQHQAEEIKEAKSAEIRSEQSNNGGSSAALGSSIGDKATAVAAQAAAAIARPTATTPRAPARSKEQLAAIKIQTACRGYMARRAHQARGLVRLMSLVEGIAVKRQTEETLYCMQTMTRVQTQIYSRRVKTEEDKKALKSQIHVKQGLDKMKIGEDWDRSHQSKEQMAAVLTMKQEAASRRQRALAYAFSHQWRNRNPSSARAAPPPLFMDPGNPNWGWSWTERWMAAARPWESHTAPDSDRAPAKSAGRTRVAISVQIPTTPGRSFRPPSCPSPSTPTPRSPSVLGRTSAVPATASPRSSPLHRSASGLRRTTSLQSERPRSSQESPGRGSPLHGGKNASLRRTTSLRSGELPRRLSLGGAGAALARDDDASEASAPVTPSYMQPTKSVSAKARCRSPAVAAVDKVDLHERAQVSSPSVKKRQSMAFPDKPSVSSPSKAKADRARRHSQPPSPRL